MFLLKDIPLAASRFTHFTRSYARLATISATVLLISNLSAQTIQRPRILGLSHIAIFAHDYEKSRAFYGEFLGFEEPYSLKNPDGSPSMTFFKVNDRQVIELSPEPQAGTDRLSHIAIQTDDAEGMRVYLASKGVKVPAQALVGRIGNLAFNVTDPAGHTVEIVQYLPNGKTLLAKGQYITDKAVSNRILHAGLIVTDLDPEFKFHTGIVGFKEIWRGSYLGTVLSWINLKVPDGDDYVEFMLSKDARDPTDWGELHHLCLVVPDVPAAVAKLKAEPYYEKYGREIKIVVGVNRKRQANLFDPDGTRTEIMEANTIDGKPAPSSTAPPPH